MSFLSREFRRYFSSHIIRRNEIFNSNRTRNIGLNLPLSNAGLDKVDFEKRRLALAEKLATQGPIIGLSGVKSEIDRKQRVHCVIISSAQRRYQVDKIPYIFRQATDFRYLTGSLDHNSALVLYFNGTLENVTSTILLPELDPREEIWEVCTCIFLFLS